ncbi:hypothetical protein EW026_g1097 [Hermanssonia centrifuga]|uniref:Mif2/CENP-C cupin domain-containing protein n=1 Tax=Hermanssonia centrifuga TaxID=98765 RepID=A0A4S4KSM2_9APHY|nr:hypothetical protein EW026_g1097 [Hermanssonia centrifuga]
MPVSARKSSFGATRRGPQKYIPYRADDLQHGKRTGIAVGYVDHNSDEFEPFDKVMSQADLRTPPKIKMHNKKKRPPKTPIIEDDEDGEMSMELEESNPNSPAAYFASARVGSITSSVQRIGSSSRPVLNHSDVDFDKVPSPRPRSSSSFARHSMANGRSSRPSHLSRSAVAEDMDSDSEFGRNDYAGDFEGGFDTQGPPSDESDHERTPVPRRKQSISSRRPSFAQMSQDLEEEPELEADVEEEAVQEYRSANVRSAKGKQRAMEEHEDEDMEDDIAQGLAEVELQQEDDDVEQEEELPRGKSRRRELDDTGEKEQRPNKKARTENDEATKPKKPRGRPRKENVLLVQDNNIDDGNVRRGQRMRYKPLEWWRLEKVVYGRRENGQCLVPNIKEIRRVPKEEVQPLGAKHRRKRQTRSKSQSITEPEIPMIYNPEEGWDMDTKAEGVVVDYETKQEVTRRVAFTSKMVRTRPAANADFFFQKIFGDKDFMAAGMLSIPPNGEKPTKGTKDNTFIFYLVEGAVNFKVVFAYVRKP